MPNRIGSSVDDLYSSATMAGRPGTSISNMVEGDVNDPRAGHMTPRRVKRRSYTRSSARSASKAMTGTNKSHHRSSTRSYHGGMRNKDRVLSGSGAAGGKSTHMNPVNRLIDDQQRLNQKNPGLLPPAHHASQIQNDSSTSNDETRNAMIAAERMYGQINPGFQNSRPNSMVYSVNQNDVQAVNSSQQADAGAHGRNIGTHTNPQLQQGNTDYEVSRPPSALTSYSNFHGQRRPLPTTSQDAAQAMQMSAIGAEGGVAGGGSNLGGSGMGNRLLQHDLPPASLGLGINLTQENITQPSSLHHHHHQALLGNNNNTSFDDVA